MTVNNFIHSNNPLTLDEAKIIYKKVVNVVNALTEICISHTDLHQNNIMIDPKTKDIKVIDVGLCVQNNNTGYQRDRDQLNKLFYSLMWKAIDKDKILKEAPIKPINTKCIPPIRDKNLFVPNNEFEFNLMLNYYDDLAWNSIMTNEENKMQKMQNYIDYILKYPEHLTPTQLRNANQMITQYTKKVDSQFEKYRKEIYREYNPEALMRYPIDFESVVLEPLGIQIKIEYKEPKTNLDFERDIRDFDNLLILYNNKNNWFKFLNYLIRNKKFMDANYKNKILMKLKEWIENKGELDFQPYYDIFEGKKSSKKSPKSPK
jgi:serine/threonine protein kinase